MFTEEHVAGSVGTGVTERASAFRTCQNLATVTLNVPRLQLQSLQQKRYSQASVWSSVDHVWKRHGPRPQAQGSPLSSLSGYKKNALSILQRSTCFVELYCEIEDICHLNDKI